LVNQIILENIELNKRFSSVILQSVGSISTAKDFLEESVKFSEFVVDQQVKILAHDSVTF
jgi:hypothetical protein